MIHKTKDYSMFKFVDDNRKEIATKHVENLKKSISARNLLNLRPITVNKKMEVIDGQHRLLAAKDLGLEIYYEIREDLEQKDLINLNVVKSWSMEDYLNYYVKNGYPEYIKFNDLIKKHKMTISYALRVIGGGRARIERFRSGNLKIKEKRITQTYETILELKDLIRSLKPMGTFLNSVRSDLALTRVIEHENYNHEKFRENIKRLIDKIEPKATDSGYAKMYADIFNWRNSKRVSWDDNE